VEVWLFVVCLLLLAHRAVAHRAVIFAIAQLFWLTSGSLQHNVIDAATNEWKK